MFNAKKAKRRLKGTKKRPRDNTVYKSSFTRGPNSTVTVNCYGPEKNFQEKEVTLTRLEEIIEENGGTCGINATRVDEYEENTGPPFAVDFDCKLTKKDAAAWLGDCSLHRYTAVLSLLIIFGNAELGEEGSNGVPLQCSSMFKFGECYEFDFHLSKHICNKGDDCPKESSSHLSCGFSVPRQHRRKVTSEFKRLLFNLNTEIPNLILGQIYDPAALFRMDYSRKRDSFCQSHYEPFLRFTVFKRKGDRFASIRWMNVQQEKRPSIKEIIKDCTSLREAPIIPLSESFLRDRHPFPTFKVENGGVLWSTFMTPSEVKPLLKPEKGERQMLKVSNVDIKVKSWPKMSAKDKKTLVLDFIDSLMMKTCSSGKGLFQIPLTKQRHEMSTTPRLSQLFEFGKQCNPCAEIHGWDSGNTYNCPIVNFKKHQIKRGVNKNTWCILIYTSCTTCGTKKDVMELETKETATVANRASPSFLAGLKKKKPETPGAFEALMGI